MGNAEDKDTRYYLDLDLATHKVLAWGHRNRYELAQELDTAAHHRIFLTKGQYNKLEKKHSELVTGK